MDGTDTNQIISPADPGLLDSTMTQSANPLKTDDINHITDEYSAMVDSTSSIDGFNLSENDPIQSTISAPETTPTDDSLSIDSDLLALKQQAMRQLTPLVDKLEQEPLEKFRTTMMIIQANDDKTLINAAFSVAQKITDDKERAQALLDIINEINYFTNR